MSIRAVVTTDAYGNIIVQMRGGLDYENTAPLRQELQQLVKSNPHSIVTLDMGMVEFVGSSGIGSFAETICNINQGHVQGKLFLSNVKMEFKKVFKLYAKGDSKDIERYIQEFDLDTEETRTLNIIHGGKQRTFEN